MSFETIPPAGYLAEPVRRYLHRYLELSRETFLRNKVRRASNFHRRKGKGNGPWHTRLEGPGIIPRSADWPELTEEDIRIHAWLLTNEEVDQFFADIQSPCYAPGRQLV
jgi:hypothetical protein